jgi:hypothetical protein
MLFVSMILVIKSFEVVTNNKSLAEGNENMKQDVIFQTATPFIFYIKET